MQIQFSEKELEDFLCRDENLLEYLGLKFIARQVNIAPVGIIDILAYHRRSKCWVIVELKKSKLDSYAFIQGLSYLNFYKDTKSNISIDFFNRKRKFCLLLVGDHLDQSIEKVVTHYDARDSSIFPDRVHYTLFQWTFDEGIRFNYYLPTQLTFQKRISDLHENNYLIRIETVNPTL